MYLRLNLRREMLNLILYVIICNFASFTSGASFGLSAIVLPVLTSNTSSVILNTMELSLFASIIHITGMFGCLLTPVTLKYGRRCNMIICGVIFSLGWSLIASSYNVIQLMIGRAITGLGCGLCYYSTEIYLIEISTVNWREIVTMTPFLMFNIGILIVYFLGFIIKNNWRLIAAIFIIPSVSLVLCNIFFLCESPMWLLLKGRKEAAKTALLRIRGLRQETIEFQEEFASMVNYSQINNNEMLQNCQSESSSTEQMEKRSSLARTIWSKLENIQRVILLPEVWKPFVILNVFFLFQQFNGVIVIIAYTVDIFTKLNVVSVDPFLMTVILGIIQLIINVIAMCCSKRIDRRPIMIVSGAGMSIFLGILIVYLQFFENSGVSTISLACILIFVGFGFFGFYSIGWALIAELYPTKYVGVLGQFTTVFCNLWAFIIKELYPVMVMKDRNATFLFYFIISVIATVFVMITLPETRGRTKIQIEAAFRGKSL